MPPTFDPAAFPTLQDLVARLRELAGDAAYQAGRDYFRKGLVKEGAVAMPQGEPTARAATAYATVTGSTDYRVSVAFGDEAKVTCTCPAYRRSKFCKHVVAVCVALAERPDGFPVAEAAPEVQKPRAERVRRARGSLRAQPAELRVSGLETVDRLMEELAAGGVMTLGPDKAALLASAAELVRALKLRRLGNLVMALKQAAGDRRGEAMDPGIFARLLVDLWVARRSAGAYLEGRISLDPMLAEDLLGKTWREEELEPVAGLELVELAYRKTEDGEFRVETSYLADIATGAVYAEKQITPVRLSSPPKPRHRHRLLLEEGRLYPGVEPRRIRLLRQRHAPLMAADIERLLAHAPNTVAELRQRLVERCHLPFGPAEVAVLFRPAALVMEGELAGAVDIDGHYLGLDWPGGWAADLASLLPEAGAYALFGLLELNGQGLGLRCLSALSSQLRWSRGPLYPDAG